MIHIVLGTRAQLIKVVPVMAALREEGIPYRFIHTGQHRATMREILDDFSLPPPDVLLHDGPDIVSLPQMLSWSLRTLKRARSDRRSLFPGSGGIVVVHGDTVSTLLGALMGRSAGLHVGHIESGLRSFDLLHPFPEELTRLITLRLSDTLFCPGEWAVKNTARLKKNIIDTGVNTMADTVAMAAKLSRRKDHLPEVPFSIISLHRYENIFHRRRLRGIVGRLEKISRGMKLLFILHPPTEARLRRFGLLDHLAECEGIDLRPRYGYLDFFGLLRAARFVICDGGSIQEESSYLGVPCLLMRKRTERPEGLGENVVLSRYDPSTIERFVDTFDRYRQPPRLDRACASEVIVSHLREYS